MSPRTGRAAFWCLMSSLDRMERGPSVQKTLALSPKMEFMLGIGPEWIHTNAYGKKTSSAGIEVAPDFMFWPSKKRRFGWYVEPSYDYKLGAGHEHSLGLSGALLISIF